MHHRASCLHKIGIQTAFALRKHLFMDLLYLPAEDDFIPFFRTYCTIEPLWYSWISDSLRTEKDMFRSRWRCLCVLSERVACLGLSRAPRACDSDPRDHILTDSQQPKRGSDHRSDAEVGFFRSHTNRKSCSFYKVCSSSWRALRPRLFCSIKIRSSSACFRLFPVAAFFIVPPGVGPERGGSQDESHLGTGGLSEGRHSVLLRSYVSFAIAIAHTDFVVPFFVLKVLFVAVICESLRVGKHGRNKKAYAK